MVVTLRDRLVTRLRACSLDRALASGAALDDDVALALRAQMLVRACVVEAAPELARLASRLQAVGPVEAKGVAQVRVLLSDGTGPLYDGAAPEDLRAAALGALAALAP